MNSINLFKGKDHFQYSAQYHSVKPDPYVIIQKNSSDTKTNCTDIENNSDLKQNDMILNDAKSLRQIILLKIMHFLLLGFTFIQLFFNLIFLMIYTIEINIKNCAYLHGINTLFICGIADLFMTIYLVSLLFYNETFRKFAYILISLRLFIWFGVVVNLLLNNYLVCHQI